MVYKPRTHLGFLNNTVKYYSEDTSRRATIPREFGEACQYRTPDGRMCAIGRCIPDGDYDSHIEGETGIDVAFSLGILGSFNDDFIDNIQSLHDRKYNWDENGLTEAGLCRVEQLRNEAKRLDAKS